MRVVHAALERAHGDLPEPAHSLVREVELRLHLQGIAGLQELRHRQAERFLSGGRLDAHEPERAEPEVLKRPLLRRGLHLVVEAREHAVFAVVPAHGALWRRFVPGEVALGVGDAHAAARALSRKPQVGGAQHARIQLHGARLPRRDHGAAALVKGEPALPFEVRELAHKRAGRLALVGDPALFQQQGRKLAIGVDLRGKARFGRGQGEVRRLPPGQAARGEELLRRADVEGAGRVQAKGLVRAGGPGRLARGQGERRPVRGLHAALRQKERPHRRDVDRQRRVLRRLCALKRVGDDARGQAVVPGPQVRREVHRLIIAVPLVALAGAADKGFAVHVQAIAVRGGYAQLGPLHRPFQVELQAEERGLGLVAPSVAQASDARPLRTRKVAIDQHFHSK